MVMKVGSQIYVDLCKASDMHIVNGRLFQDKGIGACTCMRGAGSSVHYL